MLFLQFQLGKDRYVLEATQVVEVLPLVQVKALPNAPRGVAGLFDYRGSPVPIIDLNAMALGSSAAHRLSTRIILVNYPDDHDVQRLLGLIAEQVTATLRCESSDFVPNDITVAGMPYLGPVLRDEHGIIQRVELAQLLSPAVKECLFQEARG